MYRLSTRQVSTLTVPLLPPATTPPLPLAVPLLPPATTARPCKRKFVSEDDGPRQKFRTTTDSPCVFSLGDVVAIGMSVNRFDFAHVENNISKTKFEITYLKKSAAGTLQDMKRRGAPYKDNVNINSIVHVITLMQGKVSDDELQTIKGILLREFH